MARFCPLKIINKKIEEEDDGAKDQTRSVLKTLADEEEFDEDAYDIAN
jgi:hypothetical protein